VTSSLPEPASIAPAVAAPSHAVPAGVQDVGARAVAAPCFLLAVDLEDIRILVDDGLRYRERVPATTQLILSALDRHDARITFFTTGDVARRHPELVREIFDRGHEIACHGDLHEPLARQVPDGFRDEIGRCLDAYEAAGVPAERVRGYRAPIGSLTAETRWAYDVLKERGFEYSSSVCATARAIYPWPEFGPDLPRDMEGIWEIPITLTGLPGFDVPVGGIFFRVLPFALTRRLIERKLRQRGFVATYVHPYDVDVDQERFMHPEIGESRFYNWLMYLNRRHVIPRFESLLGAGYTVLPMGEWVRDTLKGAGGTHEDERDEERSATC
jgi:polysaccharide deacetylase family protein (PEP-CTERM system associated)